MELSDCEKTQALALQILLSLSKFNQHRIHEMDCYHGYSMIHQVLIKSKCIVGYHMLKVSDTSTFPRSLCCFLHGNVPAAPCLFCFCCCVTMLLLLDPLDVSVIELRDGCALK